MKGVIHPVVALVTDRPGDSSASKTFHYGKLGLSKLVALCCSLVPGPFEPFRACSGSKVARFRPRRPDGVHSHRLWQWSHMRQTTPALLGALRERSARR